MINPDILAKRIETWLIQEVVELTDSEEGLKGS